MPVQDGFASLKLKAPKGPVPVMQLQLLMQQLTPLMRHQACTCKRLIDASTLLARCVAIECELWCRTLAGRA
jgi:hypothetical protein